jgi:hypothetical protein
MAASLEVSKLVIASLLYFVWVVITCVASLLLLRVTIMLICFVALVLLLYGPVALLLYFL